jgi:hypothetical protein
MDFIRDITNANVYVDWKAIELAGVTENTRTTLLATNIPLRQAFKKILESTGSHALEIHVMHGAIVVSTILSFADRKAQKGPYLAELSDPTLAAAMWDTRLPSVQLPPTTKFADAVDFLRDITGDDILVDWNKLKAAGIDRNNTVSLVLHDVRVSSVLYFILDQAGDGKLGYVTELAQEMRYDKTLKMRVSKRVGLITISTIDDLVASKTEPTTRPN